MKTFVLLPLSPRDLLRTAVGALVGTALAVTITARYWAYFHLASPGAYWFLILVAAPMVVAVGWVGMLGVTVFARTRHWPAAPSNWLGPALFAVALTGLVALEIYRTASARSGEGPGAGALAPFFQSLVGLR